MAAARLVLAATLVAAAAALSCGKTPYPPFVSPPASNNYVINMNNNNNNNNTNNNNNNNNNNASATGNAMTAGSEARANSWPWVVDVCSQDWFGNCYLKAGGSIIGNKWILTAAAPLLNAKLSDWRVRAGVFNLDSTSEPTQQKREIAGVWTAPGYDGGNKHNLALIELKSPLTYTPAVQPVCLSRQDTDQLAIGTKHYFVGWGASSKGGFKKPKQQQDYFYINSFCAAHLTPDAEFCAGDGSGTGCEFDWGNPLVRRLPNIEPDAWALYGVTSLTNTKCEEASTFSRVSYYCDWIKQVTGVDCLDFGK